MTIEQSEQGLVEAVAAEICGDVARRAIELMRFLASHGGRVSADHSGLDQFCDDRPGGEDTFNICCKAGYIEQVQSGFSGDEYSAVLLDKGRDRLRTSHPNAAEPVAWMYERADGWVRVETTQIPARMPPWDDSWTETPLYAHPPAPQDDARADVIVPITATDAMMEAGVSAAQAEEPNIEGQVGFVQVRAAYDAMLRAALNPTGEA